VKAHDAHHQSLKHQILALLVSSAVLLVGAVRTPRSVSLKRISYVLEKVFDVPLLAR
jgi:hypothetical protein